VSAPLELEQDAVPVLDAVAAHIRDDRRSLAEALCALRQLGASAQTPAHLRVALQGNARALRRVISVRHRARWLAAAGDVAEAVLILEVAKSILCCESRPCLAGPLDAWLPVHARAVALLNGTREQILARWRARPEGA
jgi:hypothetical protein